MLTLRAGRTTAVMVTTGLFHFVEMTAEHTAGLQRQSNAQLGGVTAGLHVECVQDQ